MSYCNAAAKSVIDLPVICGARFEVCNSSFTAFIIQVVRAELIRSCSTLDHLSHSYGLGRSPITFYEFKS